MSIGVISDTHGLLRPEAVRALEGSELIVHAGDIGSPEIITELERLAPVFAVRGNMDKGPWAREFPDNRVVEAAGQFLYILHDLKTLDVDPAAAGFQVVVSGHSHRPHVAREGGILYLNPGSAGPRRLQLPITVARLTLGQGEPRAEIVDLRLTA